MLRESCGQGLALPDTYYNQFEMQTDFGSFPRKKSFPMNTTSYTGTRSRRLWREDPHRPRN